MNDFIDRANVKLVCDGTVAGTQVVFIHEDGREEPIVPVAAAEWSLDVRDGIVMPTLKLVIEMAGAEITTPAELIDFIATPDRHQYREETRVPTKDGVPVHRKD
jgi:hypothetical protein